MAGDFTSKNNNKKLVVYKVLYFRKGTLLSALFSYYFNELRDGYRPQIKINLVASKNGSNIAAIINFSG